MKGFFNKFLYLVKFSFFLKNSYYFFHIWFNYLSKRMNVKKTRKIDIKSYNFLKEKNYSSKFCFFYFK